MPSIGVFKPTVFIFTFMINSVSRLLKNTDENYTINASHETAKTCCQETPMDGRLGDGR